MLARLLRRIPRPRAPRRLAASLAGALLLCAPHAPPLAAAPAVAPLAQPALADLVPPPYALGAPVDDRGVWTLLNSGGAPAGYVFQTGPLAPLPGFSGAPIDALVMLDDQARFIDVRLLSHNEPIFVSGLGEAPFHAFFEQYRGHSIASPMVVGTPYGQAGEASALVYLDGVTKATASVRIAHESILAAALEVARDRMRGVVRPPAAQPDPAHDEPLDWAALQAQGIAARHVVSNARMQALFAGSLWEDDDPEAADAPEAPYLDLWVVDLGPPAIARAALAPGTLAELRDFLAISPHDEPILVVEAARHGLVSDGFVRNTAPDRVSAAQDDLPVALRDADLFVELAPDAPAALVEAVDRGAALILRADRRLGFDPSRPWTLSILAPREHGVFQPQVGTRTLDAEIATPERFFQRPETPAPLSPFAEALRGRALDLSALGLGLAGLAAALGPGMNRLAGLRAFTPVRLGVLAAMTVFVGWWGQGQLSIVTVLGVIRAGVEGGSFDFLLYDPFSLLVWGAAILGFVAWGRGFFCGWLCPFGALQEFAHHLGRALRLPRIEPAPRWDRRLKRVKNVLLAALVATLFLAPDRIEIAAEIEPFKTAITTGFDREWLYVAYAVAWLGLGLVLFKGFCRYVCPLGAFMAIGGALRGRDWIARRAECGAPCQLCRVKCAYGAIEPSGRIDYAECFQCLDCVSLHDDPARCVPLVLAARGRALPARRPAATRPAAELST
ncbi:Regulator of nitric oxide reductase transcription [Albimonas donghaensis]|uniref:Regulator of nitric oxide reductase transcription n=1 Tax=Albimonas donghaensis TaxID=356660 RepID=A0A1H2TZN6_9RHOB|nr:4Fe-4S binding protein [Albimonas donghaensis]SDW48769.1 Regulator of nitric oxide reductase transcription [Albimonas donghaensis]